VNCLAGPTLVFVRQDVTAKYAVNILKLDRSTYASRSRVLVLSETAMYVLDDSLKLHNRIPYADIEVFCTQE
jgi:hypothetical protein